MKSVNNEASDPGMGGDSSEEVKPFDPVAAHNPLRMPFPYFMRKGWSGVGFCVAEKMYHCRRTQEHGSS